MRSQEILRVYSLRPRALAFLLACLPLLFAPGSAATDLCGATIIANLTLDHDLNCAATGLIVGADGIELNLNGHSITGSGTGFGISVTGRTGVSIFGGRISNFEAGVRTFNSTDIVIKDNEFHANTDGVDLAAGSHGNTVKENEFRDNRARGIMIRGSSSDHLIKENTFEGNRVGILLFGAANSIVKENTVSASVLAGIRVNVLATGNLVIENTTMANPAGIDFIMGPAGGPVGNSFVENTIATNTCGLAGPFVGNAFRENVFDGNTTDICS
jgi:parallel beta-helix repeat protein